MTKNITTQLSMTPTSVLHLVFQNRRDEEHRASATEIIHIRNGCGLKMSIRGEQIGGWMAKFTPAGTTG
jgi:hypothetical protein